jgi:tetrahydromethanopterin S-methyltransferase subunit F
MRVDRFVQGFVIGVLFVIVLVELRALIEWLL